MHSFTFIFSFPWSHLRAFLSSPSSSFPFWYACVTANLQFKWRCKCLYLANFKTGFRLEDVLLNGFLFLQCYDLIPSNLFMLMNANCNSN